MSSQNHANIQNLSENTISNLGGLQNVHSTQHSRAVPLLHQNAHGNWNPSMWNQVPLLPVLPSPQNISNSQLPHTLTGQASPSNSQLPHTLTGHASPSNLYSIPPNLQHLHNAAFFTTPHVYGNNIPSLPNQSYLHYPPRQSNNVYNSTPTHVTTSSLSLDAATPSDTLDLTSVPSPTSTFAPSPPSQSVLQAVNNSLRSRSKDTTNKTPSISLSKTTKKRASTAKTNSTSSLSIPVSTSSSSPSISLPSPSLCKADPDELCNFYETHCGVNPRDHGIEINIVSKGSKNNKILGLEMKKPGTKRTAGYCDNCHLWKWEEQVLKGDEAVHKCPVGKCKGLKDCILKECWARFHSKEQMNIEAQQAEEKKLALEKESVQKDKKREFNGTRLKAIVDAKKGGEGITRTNSENEDLQKQWKDFRAGNGQEGQKVEGIADPMMNKKMIAGAKTDKRSFKEPTNQNFEEWLKLGELDKHDDLKLLTQHELEAQRDMLGRIIPRLKKRFVVVVGLINKNMSESDLLEKEKQLEKQLEEVRRQKLKRLETSLENEDDQGQLNSNKRRKINDNNKNKDNRMSQDLNDSVYGVDGLDEEEKEKEGEVEKIVESDYYSGGEGYDDGSDVLEADY